MADVGVVMPLYTQKPEFLRQALESVLRQTFTEFRLIIVIDGAPDMEPLVRSIITEDPRVTIISYVQNRGIAHALNTGFDLLFSEPSIQYLSWVSSDNVYEPRFLEILRGALMKGPQELGIVYSSFQSIDN
ncbi:MAG TPA: glycosyltransferase family 2 protein, partial [Paenibacillus sp.]|nr:glycosyltransferase family 2 protein [Paenibacillus sp.]